MLHNQIIITLAHTMCRGSTRLVIPGNRKFIPCRSNFLQVDGIGAAELAVAVGIAAACYGGVTVEI